MSNGDRPGLKVPALPEDMGSGLKVPALPEDMGPSSQRQVTAPQLTTAPKRGLVVPVLPEDSRPSDDRVKYPAGDGFLTGSRNAAEDEKDLSDKKKMLRLLRTEINQHTVFENAEFAALALENSMPSARAGLLLEGINNPNTFLDDFGRLQFTLSRHKSVFQMAGYAIGGLEFILSDEKLKPETRKRAEKLRDSLESIAKNKELEWKAEEKKSKEAKTEEISPGVAGALGVLRGFTSDTAPIAGGALDISYGESPVLKEGKDKLLKDYESIDQSMFIQVLDGIDLPRKLVAYWAMEDTRWQDLFTGTKLSPQNWANFVRRKAEEKNKAALGIYYLSRAMGAGAGTAYAGYNIAIRTLTDRLLDKKPMTEEEMMRTILDSHEDGTSFFINIFTDPTVFMGLAKGGAKAVVKQAKNALKKGRKVQVLDDAGQVVYKDGNPVYKTEQFTKEQIDEIVEDIGVAAETANRHIVSTVQTRKAIDLPTWEKILKERNLMKPGEDIVDAIKRLTGRKSSQEVIALKRRLARLETKKGAHGVAERKERLLKLIERAEKADDLIAGGVRAGNAAERSLDEIASVMRRFSEPEVIKQQKATLVGKGLVSKKEIDEFAEAVFDLETGNVSSGRVEALAEVGLESTRPGGPVMPLGYRAVYSKLKKAGVESEVIRKEFGSYGNFYGQQSARFSIPFFEQYTSVPWRLPGMAQHQVERSIQKITAKFQKKMGKETRFPQRPDVSFPGKRAEEFDVVQEKLLSGLTPSGVPVVTRSSGAIKRMAKAAGVSAAARSTNDLIETMYTMPNAVKKAPDGGLDFHRRTLDPMWKMEDAEGVVLDVSKGSPEIEGQQFRMFTPRRAVAPSGRKLEKGTLPRKEQRWDYSEGEVNIKLEEFREAPNYSVETIDKTINIKDIGKKRKISRIAFKTDPETTRIPDNIEKELVHSIRGHVPGRKAKRTDKKGKVFYTKDPGGTGDFQTAVKKMKAAAVERAKEVWGLRLSKKEIDEVVNEKVVWIEHEPTIAGLPGTSGQANTYPITIGDLSKLKVKNMDAADVDFFPDNRELYGVTDDVDTDGIRYFIRPLRNSDEAVRSGRAPEGLKVGDLSQEELDYVQNFKAMMNRNWQDLVKNKVLSADDVGYSPLVKGHYPRRFQQLRTGIIETTIPDNPFSSPAVNALSKKRSKGFGISISDTEQLERLKMSVPSPVETLPHYSQSVGRAIGKRKYELLMADIFGRPRSQFLRSVTLKPGKHGEGVVVTRKELDDLIASGEPQPVNWWNETRTTEQWDEWAKDARRNGVENKNSKWKMMENAQGEEIIIDADIANYFKNALDNPEKIIESSLEFRRSKIGQTLLGALKIGKGLSNVMKRGILVMTPGFFKVNIVTDTIQLMSMGMTNPVKYYRLSRKLLKNPEAFKMKLPTGEWVTGTELLANARKHNLVLDSIERLDLYGTSLTLKERLAIAASKTSGNYLDPVKWWPKIKNVGIKQGEQATGAWMDTTQLAGFLYNVKKCRSYMKAADLTLGVLIDYGDRDMFLNFLRVFLPFATWAAKAPYATAKGFVSRPAVYQFPTKWRKVLAEGEEEREGPTKKKPQWAKAQALYLRLPKIEKEIISNVQQLAGGQAIKPGEQVIQRYRAVPIHEAWQPILSSAQALAKGDVSGAIGPWAAQSAGPFQHFYEKFAERSAQTGAPLDLPPDLSRPVAYTTPGFPPASSGAMFTQAQPGQPGPLTKYYLPYAAGIPGVGPLIAPLVSRPGMMAMDVAQYNWPGREGAPVRMFGAERPASSAVEGRTIQARQLIGLITGATPYSITAGSAAATYSPEEERHIKNLKAANKALKKLIRRVGLQVEKEKRAKE